MDWKGVLKGGLTFKDDQEKILNNYFSSMPGRVIVSAGAGTGKTTLLVEIYTEAALRLFLENPRENPFEKILAVTFTIEATRQMKKKVRGRLEQHFKAINDEVSLIQMLQWLESESKIFTLDSLTRDLLSTISLEAGLNPLITVPDEFEINNIKEDIIEQIIADKSYEKDIDLLSTSYPDFDWRGDNGWKSMLYDIFAECRKYGLTLEEFRKNATKTLNDLYQNNGKAPTNSVIKIILSTLSENDSLTISPDRVKVSYEHNINILESFCRVLAQYEKLYDFNTMDKGWVGHDDARFLLIRYINGNLGGQHKKWNESQKMKYLHVLVDEFQDTSYAQCLMIKNFIGPKTSVFLIGDPKQAIYQWRNADPQIFLDIIKSVSVSKGKASGNIPYLDTSGFVVKELLSNFRSNDDLIEMFNEMFGESDDSVFEDDSCVNHYSIPHSNLMRKATIPPGHEKDPFIHLITGEDEQEIPNILQEIMLGHRVLYIREGEGKDAKWQKATLGDCCILMQSRGKWEDLRTELVARGIRYVMLAETGLFSRPEISLLIDILDWLGSPHKKDPLVRILRSPLVGLSERSLRYLATLNFNIAAAFDNKDKPEWFEDESSELIQGLIDLRDDLRWMREGKKSEMIEKVLRYSHLDTILLAYIEGELCLANIRYFQDIISTWEEEELINYPELIERMKFFRDNGSDAYNMAVMADETDKTSVKIATVHGTKGLEFPIVFHYYTKLGLDKQMRWGILNNKFYVQDFGQFFVLRQIAPPHFDAEDWEKYFMPSTSIAACVLRTDRPFAYDGIINEIYAEKWRLYYVAMTRAKDHIFHNMGEDERRSMSWLQRFKTWCDGHNHDGCVELVEPIEEPIGDGGALNSELQNIKFDEKGYLRALMQSQTFTPRSLNPSHIYDLIHCPRYYQYAILQNVKGGPNDQFGIPTDYDSVRFGKHVHRALELRDFSQAKPNKEYKDFIGSLINRDRDEGTRVDQAVQKFIDSKFFRDYKISSRRHKKEYDILYPLVLDGLSSPIYMDDTIDLIIEDLSNSVILVDYKTNYPVQDNPGSEFLKRHYDYQLASYILSIEDGLGIHVSDVCLLSYNPDKKEWIKQSTSASKLDIKKEISKKIPLKIIDGGLEYNPDKKFCQDYCEFSPICKPFL